jgi:hypothetical protein
MSVSELFYSRAGETSFTGNRFIRLFRVTLVGTTPELTHPLTDSALPQLGTGFAQFPGLTLNAMRVVDKIDHLNYIVECQYGTPTALIATFGTAWEASFSGGLQTVRRNVARLITADGVPIGGANDLVIVGPNIYERDENGPYRAKFGTTTVNMRRLEQRRLVGMDVSSTAVMSPAG